MEWRLRHVIIIPIEFIFPELSPFNETPKFGHLLAFVPPIQVLTHLLIGLNESDHKPCLYIPSLTGPGSSLTNMISTRQKGTFRFRLLNGTQCYIAIRFVMADYSGSLHEVIPEPANHRLVRKRVNEYCQLGAMPIAYIQVCELGNKRRHWTFCITRDMWQPAAEKGGDRNRRAEILSAAGRSMPSSLSYRIKGEKKAAKWKISVYD